MRIGIISAMEIEQSALLKQFDSTRKRSLKNGMDVVRVEAFKHTLFCALSGVGKVHAALSTLTLLKKYDCDIVLNSGIAGGVSLPVGTIVLSTAVAYHDVDVTSFGNYARGQLPGMPVRFNADATLLNQASDIAKSASLPTISGLIASGDQFVTQQASIEGFMQDNPDLKAVDMEAAAIAHVAYQAKVPFLVIRSISDTIDSENQHHDFETFCVDAAHKAAQLLTKLVAAL